MISYKQRGPEAAAASNVFFHMTYEGTVNIDRISDPVSPTPRVMAPTFRTWSYSSCLKEEFFLGTKQSNLSVYITLTPFLRLTNTKSAHYFVTSKGIALMLEFKSCIS